MTRGDLRHPALAAAGAALLLAGGWACSPVDTAVNAAAEEVGEAAGEAIVREYTPEFRNWYASYITRVAFASGGYSVAPVAADYETGEYTIHRMEDAEGDLTAEMTRAKLFVDEEGNQAWKVKFVDRAARDTTVLEYLFSPERSELLRLRARWPDEATGSEVPVEEDTYYREPRALTEESLEGATVGTETITVPAGEFEAEHVRFDLAARSGSQSWWMNDAVPGGVVRYAARSDEAASDRPEDADGLPGDRYVMELVEHGSGAESELGMEP